MVTMHHVACLMASLVNSGKFACVKLVLLFYYVISFPLITSAGLLLPSGP